MGGGVSTSRLLINVTREHNGSQVECVATNPTRPNAPVKNTTTLTVHCELLPLRCKRGSVGVCEKGRMEGGRERVNEVE